MTVPKHRQVLIYFLGYYCAADGTSAATRRKWRLRYIAILWATLKLLNGEARRDAQEGWRKPPWPATGVGYWGTAATYWSPPATLVSPNLWNFIGSPAFADVPSCQYRKLDSCGRGSASRKVLGKLLTEHLIEEIPAQGSLPVWRRDEDKGPVALRCPGAGLSGRNCVRYLGLRDGFLSDQLPCMLMIGVYDSSYRWPQGSPCESGANDK